jgi:hypothetical protein
VKKKRLLFFADQPWQIEFACKVITKLVNEFSHIECLLVVSDFYCVVHEKGYLEDLRNKHNFVILDFFEIYKKWQIAACTHQHHGMISRPDWAKKYESRRSLEQVERSNQLIYGFEREFYFLKMRECCREMIFSDLSLAVDRIIEETNPVAVVSIERQTLPVNIAQVVSEHRKIPWFSILPTRLGSRWYVSDEFGLGMSESKFQAICSYTSLQETRDSVEEFVTGIREKFMGSYITWIGGEYFQSADYSDLVRKKKTNLAQISNWLLAFVKQLLSRFYFHPKVMTIQPVILDNSPVRLTIFEIRSLVTRIRHLTFPRRLFQKESPQKKYIFWALHVRPEGSSNVLSLGLDEVEVLKKFAAAIPSDLILVVKENPIMFGQRSLGFYKSLSEISNVYLVDPFISSVEFISKSNGVAGISGTALLEGEILGKPAICFGRPEFEKFLGFNGWASVNSFLIAAQEGSYLPSNNLRVYLEYLFEESDAEDIPEFGNLEAPEADKMITRISGKLRDYLNL